MSKLEKQKEKARGLEGKDPKGAIEAWVEILKGQEEDPDPNHDLAIFNRIGDLYLKLREPAQAADYYDQAVVEYAERMHKVGKIQHAFAALKEFADISAESAHLRQQLEEHLRMYGDPERRLAAGTAAPAAPKAQPQDDASKSGKRKTSSLVFLDVDAPPVTKASPMKGRAAPPPLARPAPEPEPPEPEPVVESLIEPVIAEPDTSLEIETTSLVEGLEPTNVTDRLEGFETTIAEFGDIQLEAQDAPSLRDEISPEDIPPPAEFEPTVAEEESAPESVLELEPLPETEIEIEAPKPSAPPRVAPVVPKRPGVGPPPRLGGGASPKAPEPPKVKPVVPTRPGPPPRKSMVEVPPLELEPDFDTSATDQQHDIDDQPLAIEDVRAGGDTSLGF